MDFPYLSVFLSWGSQRWFIAAAAAVVAAISLGFIWSRRRRPADVSPVPADQLDLSDVYRRYGTSDTQRRRVAVGDAGAGGSRGDTAPLPTPHVRAAQTPSGPAPIPPVPRPPIGSGNGPAAATGARKLVIFDGETTREVALGVLPQRIGRHSDNDVVVNHPTVHRHHAVFALNRANQLELRDLGGTNGIYINGERKEQHRLTSGDVVELGEVQVRYLEA